MRKTVVIALIILALGAFGWWYISSRGTITAADTTSLPSSSNNTNTPISTTPTQQPTNTPTPSQSSAAFKDGTYTGSTADAFYGPLQVQATISSGKLVDITYLQYPKDQQHSQEVSNMSLPVLKQEAIASQSAQVSTVSGATQTSAAFRQSLSSALAQAK